MIKPARLLLAILIVAAMALLPFTHFGARVSLATPLNTAMADSVTPGHPHHGHGLHLHHHDKAEAQGDKAGKPLAKTHDCKACQQCPACSGSLGAADLTILGWVELAAKGGVSPTIRAGTGPPPNLRPPTI